jgi:hypothetical protein
VLVDAPAITRGQSTTLLELEFPVAVIGPPPGNRDTVLALLSAVDEIAGIWPIRDASPGTYQVGQQELPAYITTLTIQIRRNLT